MPGLKLVLRQSSQALRAVDVCRVPSLQGLPEELVCEVFEEVLLYGRLTPRVLEVFERTGHSRVLKRIEGLHIQQLPPVLPITTKKWLGW